MNLYKVQFYKDNKPYPNSDDPYEVSYIHFTTDGWRILCGLGNAVRESDPHEHRVRFFTPEQERHMVTDPPRVLYACVCTACLKANNDAIPEAWWPELKPPAEDVAKKLKFLYTGERFPWWIFYDEEGQYA